MDEREAPVGFIVGTVNEPGYCEACHDKLRVGDRAAIWSAQASLFCIECARRGSPDEYADAAAQALITVILLVVLLALVVWGLV